MGANAGDEPIQATLHLVAVELGLEALTVIELQLHLLTVDQER